MPLSSSIISCSSYGMARALLESPCSDDTSLVNPSPVRCCHQVKGCPKTYQAFRILVGEDLGVFVVMMEQVKPCSNFLTSSRHAEQLLLPHSCSSNRNITLLYTKLAEIKKCLLETSFLHYAWQLRQSRAQREMGRPVTLSLLAFVIWEPQACSPTTKTNRLGLTRPL